MRLSYLFNTEMNTEEVKKAINFFNDCILEVKEDLLIDFYLNSPGGTIESYQILRDYMERASFDINIIATGCIDSSAFLLFYCTNRVFKTLLPHTSSVIHTVTVSLDDRDLRKPDSMDSIEKTIVDDMNREFLEELKLNKAFSLANYKKVRAGQDIMLKYIDLYQVMLKCPYGSFLKINEQIA